MAVVLLVLLRFFRNSSNKYANWGLRGLAALLVVAAVGAYFDFGQYPKFGTFRNPHDLFHYYLGSKYSPEIGYQDLYPAVIVAARENNGKLAHSTMRRMDDYSFEKAEQVMARVNTYRNLFSPERWQTFKTDVVFFQSILGPRFSTVIQDMGYNATPVWNMIGRSITNRVPATDAGMSFLVAIDLMLLSVAFATVWRAFGWQTGLFTLVFFCTCFSTSYTHARGAFLRFDWLAALLMSMSALKTGRHKTAGALVGYAAMMRVFPLVFAVGLGGKLLWDLVRRIYPPSVPPVYGGEVRRYLQFFLSMGAVFSVLLGLTIWFDGAKIWSEFFQKITLHDSHIAPVRVGFKYIFLMTHTSPTGGWAAFKAENINQFHDLRVWWWLIQAGVLAAFLYLVKNLEDYETVAFGYVLAFFLTAPTFYYQIMVLTAVFLFLPKCDHWPRLAGVMLMFAMSIALFVLERHLKLDLRLSFIMSCLLMGLTLYMMAVTLFERGGKESRTPQPRAG